MIVGLELTTLKGTVAATNDNLESNLFWQPYIVEFWQRLQRTNPLYFPKMWLEENRLEALQQMKRYDREATTTNH